jgi:protein SDA1
MQAINASRPEVIGKLPQLQNMIKRDPDGYRSEFLMQFRHYESEYQLFLLQPTKESVHFGALVNFLSHVAKCYPKEMNNFPQQIIQLLQENYIVLNANLRKTLVQSLMLMRNRNLIDPIILLKLFFELFHCPDKRLREMLYVHIVSDLKQLNAITKNIKVNKALQNFLFDLLQENNESTKNISNSHGMGVNTSAASVKALSVLIELFRCKIWHDSRSVNVIASVCTSPHTKLLVMALNFFLGIDDNDDNDNNDDDDDQENKEKNEDGKRGKQKHQMIQVDYHLHSKKTKKKNRLIQKAIQKNKRTAKRRKEKQVMAFFPAIELLHDPVGIAEKQLKYLQKCTEKFEIKLLMMNFIGRILGFHKIVLLSFYPLLQRYLSSHHQQKVTQILAYLVQSCHDEIPPEEMLPIVKSIANNFITERCSSEVVAVGINAVREIFRRIPLVLECEGMDALIADLIMYNKSKDKSTVMAARGILNLIRELHPTLLKKKDRGKFHNENVRPKQFGELIVAEGVDGAELLAEAEEAGRFDAEENQDGWEVASSESEPESDDEWIDIQSNSSGGEEQDDDDEEEEEEEEQEQEEEQIQKKSIVKQTDRIDARRILTPKDFERIEMLKKERDAALKDPKSRSKRKLEQINAKMNSDQTKVNPMDLEGHVKKKRLTQEERLRSVLKGREDFKHKKSGGGTTNTEKKRLKHFMMIKKSRNVQSKVLQGARQIQRVKNQNIKKILKRDQKKRRRT